MDKSKQTKHPAWYYRLLTIAIKEDLSSPSSLPTDSEAGVRIPMFIYASDWERDGENI